MYKTTRYKKLENPKILRYLSVIILRIYRFLFLKFKINTNGELPKGPKIFAINHPTTTDPFLIYCLFPNAKVLINSEVFKIRILGWILRKLGHIPVGGEGNENTYVKAKDTLLQGKDIIIFPEGDLSGDVATLKKIKTGLARLALETRAPIVPIGVNIKKEGIKKYKVKTNKGDTLISSWYMFNKYVVNIGKSIKLEGSIQNREYVRKKSIFLQEQIQKLSRKYYHT